MAKNANLHKAKVAKNDNFYTQRADIENELSHYEEHFRDKVVYCNCDDTESEFWKFFQRNFKPWGLKKLIATCYHPDEKNYAYTLELSKDTNGDGIIDIKDEPQKTQIQCNGDFRSAVCIELLKQADIVVTNPPFSLFREYVAQLIEHDKKFLIIGNVNAITYKEIFPLIKENKMWLGASIHSGDRAFYVPDDYPLNAAGCGIDPETGRKYIRVKGVRWFTNLDYKGRHTPLDLRGNYYYGNEEKYPKYDNYDAINVDKTADIPCDYEPCWYKCEHATECEYAQKEGAKDSVALCEQPCNGEIGVPITFIDKYNPEQFEVIKFRKGNDEKDLTYTVQVKDNPLEAGSRKPEDRHALFPNRYSPKEENVMESSACRSLFSISSAQNNSKLSGLRQETSRGSQECQPQQGKTARTLTGGLDTEELSYRRKCNGLLGVPVTYLDKYCAEQFEIIGCADYTGKYGSNELGIKRIGEDWVSLYKKQGGKGHYTANMLSLVYYIDGTAANTFKRIIIRKMR